MKSSNVSPTPVTFTVIITLSKDTNLSKIVDLSVKLKVITLLLFMFEKLETMLFKNADHEESTLKCLLFSIIYSYFK